jgi:hypothetical protein
MTLALGVATVMLWSIQQTPETSPVSWQGHRALALTSQPADGAQASSMLSHEPGGDDAPLENDSEYTSSNAAPQNERTSAASVNQTMQALVRQGLSPAGHVPSDSEPADLRPIETGRRVSGFSRTQGGVTEVLSVWEVTDTSVEQVMAHYDKQARDAGFTPLSTALRKTPTASSDEPAMRQLLTYSRPMRGSMGQPDVRQTLSIRAQRSDAVTRVTLWLGQPSAQPTSQTPTQHSAEHPQSPSAQSQPGALR